jgi:uncharacterized Zn finger protein
MPQRGKKQVRVPKKKATTDRLKAALAKRKKSELIDMIAEIAMSDRGMLRQLESRFGVEAPPDELIDATRAAIADATDFDEREINYNFDYDSQAYSTVKRNLAQLIELGRLREAMNLSLELMSQGSYQVEMSDEGMMTEVIEECLRVVIKAIMKSDLPAPDVTAWCAEMTRQDRVGFICNRDFATLAKKTKS